MTLTAKVKICPTDKQTPLLSKTMDAYRDACGYVSGYVFDTHDLTIRTLNEKLYRPLREKFGLKSQMAQSVIRTVIARYKSVLESEGKWIKVEFRKPQYDLVWNRDYSLTGNVFSVNTLSGRLKMSFHADAMEQYFDKKTYSFGTAKLVLKHGNWYLHIPVTFEVSDVKSSDIVNVVGIDRGINFTACCYDGKKTVFFSGRQYKHKRAHYSALRKQLQMRKTPSARRRLLAIGQRENRWMQDINHCISKALVDSNPAGTLFVLEDLTGIRAATERVLRKDRYVSVSWSFYDLEQKLIYKAKRAGMTVVKVSPVYTSQRCPVCGHTEKENRNSKKHIFTCRHCGYTSNDDRTAAMNLYSMGIDLLKAI